MARKVITGHEVQKVKVNGDVGVARKKESIEEMKQSKKNGFIYLRKEILGNVPLYELNFLNKIRVVMDYINQSTGKSDRKMEARRAKEVDRLSALEVVSGNFIIEKVESMITNRTSKVGFKLDPKYNEVATQLVIKSSKRGADMEMLEVNPNYLKYCKNVPVVATLSTKKMEGI